MPSLVNVNNGLSTVPALADVRIDDAFWAPRREVVRTHTIPQQERELRTGGHLDALRGTWRPGEPEPHVFWESDVAKWIEAASYSLTQVPDPELDAAVEEVVALLAGAQEPDGYLNVYFSQVRPGRRFTDLRDAHELYCLGHLVEAAVAHHEATGRTSLLDVVRRYVDLVERELGPGGSCDGGYDGHEEIELALVRLARATGEARYLDLARRMVDARGREPFYFDAETERRGDEGYFASYFPDRPRQVQRFREYNQSHAPVREQSDAVGHAVRAMYLYCAMADLAAETGDDGLRAACERLWTSVTERKMYLTGGIGADPSIEGFAGDHELPNESSYNETCASVGLVMWAQRMGALTGEGRYGDVMELALYNTVLAGASADGTHYFYGNPMASDGGHEREPWFGCACCPPNLARLLMSLPWYAYLVRPGQVDVTLAVGGSARLDVPGVGEVRLDVATGYPWTGDVAIDVTAPPGADLVLRVRIPGWADGARAELNGEDLPDDAVVDGFLWVERAWRAGDRLSIELPMPARRVWADPRVRADLGRVAVARGPLVYCVERPLDGSADAPDPAAVVLARDEPIGTSWSDELGLVVADLPVRTIDDDAATVEADGAAAPDGAAPLHRRTPPRTTRRTAEAIPYFAWANRGPSAMRVWLLDSAPA
ncbi:hypothetical protein EDD28_1831 [Salana multivorans]|uniref:Glycoside hydrolase family 127 protein n=1 Tax=Salana multivorans TaxID=120377 RepID=A0A3N2DCR8_9MICO|nr:hypothetical protein EDD28_1831 [Salana multivorans]